MKAAPRIARNKPTSLTIQQSPPTYDSWSLTLSDISTIIIITLVAPVASAFVLVFLIVIILSSLPVQAWLLLLHCPTTSLNHNTTQQQDLLSSYTILRHQHISNINHFHSTSSLSFPTCFSLITTKAKSFLSSFFYHDSNGTKETKQSCQGESLDFIISSIQPLSQSPQRRTK